jgi:hypothetical protein
MKAALVTFFLAVGAFTAACGGGENKDGTFEGEGYSFSYPADWDETDDFDARASLGSRPSSQVAVTPRGGGNGVIVQVGPVSPVITEANVDEFGPVVAQALESLFGRTDGEVTAGPVRLEVNGWPALGFEATGVTSEGARIRSRITLVFARSTQYSVNCQYTPSGADVVEQGCDRVLDSLQIERGTEDGPPAGTFEGDGYSFSYPEEWFEFEEVETRAQAGSAISSVSFGPRLGSDVLGVDVYRLRIPVTRQNLGAVSDELVAEIDALVRQAQGRITAGPARVTVDGLPALRLEASVLDPDGARVQSRLVFVFDGTTEYLLNCQFTPEGAAEMTAGCERAVESFRVTPGE